MYTRISQYVVFIIKEINRGHKIITLPITQKLLKPSLLRKCIMP